MSSTSSSRAGPLVVQIKNLRMSYKSPRRPPLEVIEDISLDIAEGGFVAIAGPSGCGKTTVLRILAGMLTDHSGSVEIGGLPAGTTAGKGSEVEVGVVFQRPSLFPWRTVAANVRYGLELRARKHIDRATQDARVKALIDLVGLAGFESYYPHELSGGMQQRVNLARALAIQPSVLLMDEPFSALDAQTREEMQCELQEIAVRASSTVLFITHDIREAVFLADRVVVLSQRPSTVAKELVVTAPRPRDLEFQLTDDFNEAVRSVWDAVHPSGELPLSREAIAHD